MSNSVQPQRRQPTRLPRPWDSPGKNTGVDCHFILQCMKVKSQSEVTQLCLTLRDPMDCSLPGSSAHGIFQARILEWVVISFSNHHPQSSVKFANFIISIHILKAKSVKFQSRWQWGKTVTKARNPQAKKKRKSSNCKPTSINENWRAKTMLIEGRSTGYWCQMYGTWWSSG